ncbi:MAG: RidA family protein [FCB group bacterium]|nr:RidA family protein [FCB group bacterium]
MSKTIVSTPDAPAAIGPYSQGILTDHLFFSAGQIPLDPRTGKLIEGDFKERVEQVFNNLSAVLQAAGSSLDRVVKMTVFMTDLNQFKEVNEVFERRFAATQPPARSAVQVAALPMGTDIEIECIATR